MIYLVPVGVLFLFIIYYFISLHSYRKLIFELNEAINGISVLYRRRQKNFSFLLTELQRERDSSITGQFSMDEMVKACGVADTPYSRIQADENLDNCIEQLKSCFRNNQKMTEFLGVDTPIELNLRALRKKYMRSLLKLDARAKIFPYSFFIAKRGFPYSLYSLSKFDT